MKLDESPLSMIRFKNRNGKVITWQKKCLLRVQYADHVITRRR